MNKVTKTAIAGLLALFAGNAAATDGEIVFDGEILKSACEINDSDKKIEVALGHYNAEQFRNIGERSPKIPFTIPLVNCPMTGWEHDNGNVEASFRLWLETRDNGTVPNFPNLAKVGSFVGLGKNGHLGLNEPGESLQPACHISQLDARTQQHEMLKTAGRPVTRGITLGLKDILNAREVLLLVTGEGKQDATDRFLTAKVSTAIPASFLWLHSNFICLINT